MQLQTAFNCVLINLIVTDFIMVAISLPHDTVAAFLQGWKLGYVPCIATGFISTVTGSDR